MIEPIATTPGVSLNTTERQDVFSVPEGKSFIFLFAVFSEATFPFSDSETMTALRVHESVGGTHLVEVEPGQSALQANSYLVAYCGKQGRMIPAGKTVQVSVDATYGSQINNCTVRVFGHLFDS